MPLGVAEFCRRTRWVRQPGVTVTRPWVPHTWPRRVASRNHLHNFIVNHCSLCSKCPAHMRLEREKKIRDSLRTAANFTLWMAYTYQKSVSVCRPSWNTVSRPWKSPPRIRRMKGYNVIHTCSPQPMKVNSSECSHGLHALFYLLMTDGIVITKNQYLNNCILYKNVSGSKIRHNSNFSAASA